MVCAAGITATTRTGTAKLTFSVQVATQRASLLEWDDDGDFFLGDDPPPGLGTEVRADADETEDLCNMASCH